MKKKTLADTKFTFLEKDYEGATVYIGNLNYKKDEIGVRDHLETFLHLEIYSKNMAK